MNHPKGASADILPFRPVDRRKVIDVADLVVWAYGVEKADRVPATVGPRGSVDSIVRIENIGNVGVRVDTSINVASGVHADAEMVHDMVVRLGGWMTGALIDFGRSGLVPDWVEVWEPEYAPVPGRRQGKPKMIRDEHDNPIACEVRLIKGAPWTRVINMRTIYGMWWEALNALATELRKVGLDDHRVTGPAHPQAPWITSLDATEKR